MPALALAVGVLAQPAAAQPSLLPSLTLHRTGLLPTPHRTSSAAAIARALQAAADVPASVDLTAHAMPVGDQGAVGSCAAWASDYTALGYWENEEGIPGGALEPMYTYAQVTGGIDEGSTIEGNLQIDQQQGVDSQSDYTQGNYDYYDQPTAIERADAVNWKLSGYTDLAIVQDASSTVTQDSIEAALAAGDPVVIGIPVWMNFETLGSDDNGYYDSPSGNFMGYHAITALGYDSDGLVIENSWGPFWANSGYATLSWSFVNQYVFDAVSVGPLVVGQPAASGTPTITGTANVGARLTAGKGTWSPAGTSYSYQWQRTGAGGAWTPITGATSTSYVLGSADSGHSVRIFVTAVSGSGRGTAFAAVGPVTDLPYATAAPAVSGTDRQGDTLKASKGTWNPAGTTYAYQWQIMLNGQWANLFGATGATHVVQEAGEVDRLQVAATNSNGTTYAYSASVGPALSGQPHNTSPPAVLGIVARGHTLTAQAGSWSPSGTYAYQWQTSSDGGQTWSNIDGANYSTYTVAVGDEGHTLRVQVTGTNSYGGVSASSKASATVAASAPADKTAPAITGTAASGHALIASTGSWAGVGNTYAYQWQENAGSGFVDIDGATGSAYQVAPSDRGSTIRVVVTASNPDGQAAATSKSTPAVSS